MLLNQWIPSEKTVHLFRKDLQGLEWSRSPSLKNDRDGQEKTEANKETGRCFWRYHGTIWNGG